MLCTRSCGQAYTGTGERAGRFQTRKRWKLCLWAVLLALFTGERRDRASLAGLKSSWANQRAPCFT